MAGLPHDVRAWACAFCGKMYPRTKWGKERARLCCLCSECKTGPARRTGEGQICRQCGAKKELAAAEEYFKHAQERLEKARANQNGAM
jgi:hypothetical protein